MSSENSS